MAPNALTSTGLTTATQAELLTYFTNGYTTIYGNQVNLASNTPDGQFINLLIQALLDAEDLMSSIYNSFDPDQAIGVTLDQRVAINGIQRLGGTYTIQNITIVMTQSVNLYGLDQSAKPVYTVQDSNGVQWELITTQLGVTGTQSYAFEAALIGATQSAINTITVPVTVVLGVSSVNNPTTFTTLGLVQEADAVLRVRRQASVSISSQGYFQGLLAAVENVNGVTSAYVYENNGSTTDANGVPGHSIWVIIAGTPTSTLGPAYSSTVSYSYGAVVSGGAVNYISWQNNNLNNSVGNSVYWGVYNPVAQAIYQKRNAAAGLYGSTSYTVTQIDGSPFVIYYDTVTIVGLFIAMNLTSINGINPPNGAGIVNGLPTTYIPGVAQEVNVNAVSTFVQDIDPNSLVTNAGIALPSGGNSNGIYLNIQNPALKKNQFLLQTTQIIALTPGAVTVAHTLTYQFTAFGGSGTITWAFVTNNSGGTISGSGLYTAGSTGSVTDTIKITDALLNTITATITVT